jgi:hypothetical protein
MRVVEGARVIILGRTCEARDARLHSEVGLAQATSFDKNLFCALWLVKYWEMQRARCA